MANEKRLIAENDIYALFGENGTARLHVGDIDVLPRVDAVEVVRCKDCSWFNKSGYEEDNEHEEDSALHMGFCLHWRRGTQACRFCSYGERKDNNGRKEN